MADKIIALKEKQQELGEKLNRLQETNKQKDQEAAEIKELLASCKDNLDRIKSMTGSNCSTVLGGKKVQYEHEGETEKSNVRLDQTESESVPPCVDTTLKEERVTCRIDLSKMKIRVKGPPEDLRQLNAAQLISMLDKFGCQELIIDTRQIQKESSLMSPSNLKSKVRWYDFCGEVPIMYLMHPGHLVMLAGVILIATLVNANLCNPRRGPKVKFLFNAVYLGTFAFHYGMILWMNVIRGQALRHDLGRETFNQADNTLLPRYFSIAVFLSALMLYSLLATNCPPPCTSWSADVIVQVLIGIITFFIELATISYVVPALVKIREITDEYLATTTDSEDYASEGFERNMEKIKILNWTLSFVNFITSMLMGANLYYISTKLNNG